MANETDAPRVRIRSDSTLFNPRNVDAGVLYIRQMEIGRNLAVSGVF